MNYTSSVQNTSQSVYTPYIIKPSNVNDYVTYIDLVKFGSVTDFGYKDGYTTFNTWQGFISSVNAHLIDLYTRMGGQIETVTNVSGVSVYPSSKTINVGETQEITATVLPSNATNKSVTWHSSNSSIATVNSSGIVTGVSAGTATITATTVDGGYTASSTITVSNNSGSNPTTYYWYIGTENPSSTSDIQTSNTVAGWHEIGSSLSGFVLDTNRTIVTVSEEERVPYYIVIPNDLHIYNALDMNVEELLFNSVTCNIPGYKSFRNKPRNGIDGAYDVTGIILKQ